MRSWINHVVVQNSAEAQTLLCNLPLDQEVLLTGFYYGGDLRKKLKLFINLALLAAFSRKFQSLGDQELKTELPVVS